MKSLLNDIAGLTGLGLVAFGCYQLAPWLAYLVSGVLLIVYALLNGKRLKTDGDN